MKKQHKKKIIFCGICSNQVEQEVATTENKIATKDICNKCFDEL